jgi:hypothetical protein
LADIYVRSFFSPAKGAFVRGIVTQAAVGVKVKKRVSMVAKNAGDGRRRISPIRLLPQEGAVGEAD